ncbi:DNA polymerase [Scopulibacillus daqui]|uniref:DNA polymerase n=1 Tax=Scopulibacillus daqui TaxID=1469162 RepID=A0ABS2Q5A0_9BACL|nr:uracil-DNA glycosylase [Scopulibacillus daqui]MBM7646672.1 DNA polymerase [Scopulibacillus daqui]
MTECKFSILKEDPVPCEEKDCQKCELYKHGSRMVWGEGHPHAPLYILLDNPGEREDKEGRPYVCGTRQVLQRGLIEAGISLKHIYVTYILKRRPKRAYNKSQTRDKCIRHLEQQLLNGRPKAVVCLGNVSVQSFFRNPQAEVKNLRGAWHHVNGWKTAVSYHPLAVRRRPNLYAFFAEDLKLAREQTDKILK